MNEEIRHLVRLALSYGRVERGVCHPDGTPETDTDHSISLAWLACSLAARYYPGLDRGVIAQYAVVHDAPEIYAGDTYAVTAGERGRIAQKEKEHAALRRLREELPLLPWLPQMITIYELQCCPEARFVRAVDKLLPKIVLRLEGRAAERLGAHGVTPEAIREYRAHEDKLLGEVAGDFPEILRLRDELNAQLSLDDLL